MSAGSPVVPWQAEELKEFTDELINAVEDSRVEKFLKLARDGKVPEKVCRQIGADSHYPAGSKRGLSLSIPRIAAKWLNKFGISAANKEEAILLGCMTVIWAQGRRLAANVKKQIADASTPPAPEVKP